MGTSCMTCTYPEAKDLLTDSLESITTKPRLAGRIRPCRWECDTYTVSTDPNLPKCILSMPGESKPSFFILRMIRTHSWLTPSRHCMIFCIGKSLSLGFLRSFLGSAGRGALTTGACCAGQRCRSAAARRRQPWHLAASAPRKSSSGGACSAGCGADGSSSQPSDLAAVPRRPHLLTRTGSSSETVVTPGSSWSGASRSAPAANSEPSSGNSDHKDPGGNTKLSASPTSVGKSAPEQEASAGAASSDLSAGAVGSSW
mmetsp:Transcript_110206/g.292677  ORF Transcript_110206/g.292677 Transcript_110206/m.292677 type:complete len:257 (-) Transcript_110206:933-1703(-)